MTDPATFHARFDELKQTLDNPETDFFGASMVEMLLELEPLLPDRASEARLFRELAVVEGKRGQEACLDHAGRALKADAEAQVLTPRERYFMHRLCGEVGVMWVNDARTLAHLDVAITLAPEAGRPSEVFWLRLQRAIHLRVVDEKRTAIGALPLTRYGLDAFEPLLTDAEAEYGATSPELSNLLSQMSAAHEAMGDMEAALAFLARSVEQRDNSADPGRRVSALTSLAGLQHRAGRVDEARATFDAAIAWAENCCSASTQGFARDEKAKLFPAP